MPEKAGEWKTQKLKFNDTEDEFTIRYRDPIAAIKSLWGDEQLSPEMVFAGCKIFSNETKKNRIFSEMHTGKWWHVIQVRLYWLFYSFFIKISSVFTSKRSYTGSCHNCNRQNATYTIFWQQVCLSSLPDYW
jgi:hypothetical protein